MKIDLFAKHDPLVRLFVILFYDGLKSNPDVNAI
jgi:hypothetical protein